MPPRGFSHYRALAEYLAIRPEHEITCTVAEIEAILGMPLPPTAFTNHAWWTDAGLAHVRLWRALGWRASLDRRNQCVHFARDAEERTMPSGHKIGDVPSRYQPLFDLLAAATGDAVTLTYKEVAALVGPLPEYAILHTGWWTGKRYDHVQAWRALGWRAHASASGQRVRFTRDAGQEMT